MVIGVFIAPVKACVSVTDLKESSSYSKCVYQNQDTQNGSARDWAIASPRYICCKAKGSTACACMGDSPLFLRLEISDKRSRKFHAYYTRTYELYGRYLACRVLNAILFLQLVLRVKYRGSLFYR